MSTGYQKSFFILSEKEFTSNNLTITPSLGIKSRLKFRDGIIEFSYGLGYKYQTDTELKIEESSRDISYGNFSASGIKQKFKISFLF